MAKKRQTHSAATDGTQRLLFLAGDVRTNMGDRAIRAALARMVRDRRPDAKIHILSKTPERDAHEFGADIFGAGAAALFLRIGAVRRMSAVVWGGGQLLQDDSSLAKNLYWAVILTWLHRVLGLPIVGMGLGIGPLNTRIGRGLAALTLSNLDLFVGRDARSRDWAATLTRSRVPVRLAPDPALFLEPVARGSALERLRSAGVESPPEGDYLVGVSVRRWFHLGRRRILPYALRARPARTDTPFENFLCRFADALRAFAADKPVRFVFFPMADADWDNDADLARRMAEGLNRPAHVLPLDCDASMVKAMAGLCDLFVGVRMHPCLLALSMGVPAVGVYHVPKVRDFFAAMNQEERTISIENVAADGGAEKLTELLNETFAKRREISAALRTRMERLVEEAGVYRAALDGLHEPSDR